MISSNERKSVNILHLFFLFFILFSFTIRSQEEKHFFIVNNKPIDSYSLNKKVECLMEEVGIPGISLAVINSGQIVFKNSYGYKSSLKNERINEETIFEACSLTKSFVVYAAYRLIDQNILDLDKPLYQYFEYEQLKHDERYKLITARMVLSHSSGIENHKEQNNPDLLEILDEPGKAYRYSGEGYVYLSKVIEKLIHKSTETYLQEMVIGPLGLHRTFSTFTRKTRENYAIGHNAFGNSLSKNACLEPDVTGRIHTTANDYATLIIAIFNGTSLSKKSISAILTPQVRTSKSNDQFYYGAGFQLLFTPEKDTIIFQGGDNDGFKGLFCYSVVHKVGFVFFANAERAETIGRALCQDATGLDITPYYSDITSNPYPSIANTLFRLLKKNNVVEVRREFDQLLKEDKITERDIIEMSYLFKIRDYELAKYIVGKYMEKNTGSSAKPLLDQLFEN